MTDYSVPAVTDPMVLKEGPVFSDEIGWNSGLQSPELSNIDVESRRIVPAKEAMRGIYSIYFQPGHRQWALVRYARRYQWLVETVLGRGLSGQHLLHRQGFTKGDIAFLRDIVPESEYNCAVYEFIWLAITSEEYLPLAEALLDVDTFVPEQLFQRHDELSTDDTGLLSQFLRRHVIISTASLNQRSFGPAETTDSAACDSSKEYMLSEDGEEVLSAFLDEYERLVVDREYEQLSIEDVETADDHVEAAPTTSENHIREPDEEEVDPGDLNSDIDDLLADLGRNPEDGKP